MATKVDPNYLKQLRASGGFVSTIPTVFEFGECPPGWDFAAFPVTVAFTGIRPNGRRQAPVLTSVYWISA